MATWNLSVIYCRGESILPSSWRFATEFPGLGCQLWWLDIAVCPQILLTSGEAPTGLRPAFQSKRPAPHCICLLACWIWAWPGLWFFCNLTPLILIQHVIQRDGTLPNNHRQWCVILKTSFKKANCNTWFKPHFYLLQWDDVPGLEHRPWAWTSFLPWAN